MPGRIKFNSIIFDFVRSFNSWSVGRNNIQTANRSDSGIVETNEFYNIDTVDLVRTWLSGTEIEQLEEWWEYVRDGSSFEIWKDKDVAFYLSFEGKNDNTNDGSSPTFTRTGVANVVDFSTGLVTSVAANTARFQSGKYGSGLLIERILSNLLTNTEDFSNAAWVKTNCTVTANQIIAPDGNVTADKLLSTAGSSSSTTVFTTATAIGTDSGTFTVWLKGGLGAGALVDIIIGDDSPADLATKAITVTHEWQQFEVTFESVGANANNWTVKININADATTIFAWGAQLETEKYNTSYISDAASRGADKVRYSLSKEWWDYKTFSLSAWIKVPYDHDEISSDRYLFLIYDEANSQEFLKVQIESASSGFTFTGYDYAGASALSETLATTTMTKDTWHYIVITVDLTLSNSVYLYIDGSLVGNVTYSRFVPWETPDELLLGSAEDGVGGQEFDGMFDDIILENKVLPTNEITARYNSGRALGVRRNYFSAVKITNTTFKPIQRVGGNRFDFNAVFEQILT